MKKLVILGILLVPFLLTSCNKDKDPSLSNCLPKSLIIGNDSIVFDFSEKNLNKISYYRFYKFRVPPASPEIDTDEFEHDPQGRLSKMMHYDLSHTLTNTYTIKYVNDLPAQVTVSPMGFSSISQTFDYTHDSKNRLTQISMSFGYPKLDFISSIRYEYNDDDNVVKAYTTYNDYSATTAEKLSRENLTFDNKNKFYSAANDLKIIDEYLYFHFPNKNNCTSAKIYYSLTNNGFGFIDFETSPTVVNYSSKYDSRGLITAWYAPGNTSTLPLTDTFYTNITYTCK